MHQFRVQAGLNLRSNGPVWQADLRGAARLWTSLYQAYRCEDGSKKVNQVRGETNDGCTLSGLVLKQAAAELIRLQEGVSLLGYK